MSDVRCADVLQWLRAAAPTARHTPSPAIQAHVAGCATCQAALLLLASAAIDGPTPPSTIDCASCCADLAVFIEREAQDPVWASQSLPQVWWHLWVCAACAEVYRMTWVLIEAEQQNELMLPDLAALHAPRISQPETLLRLARQFLARALPAPWPQASVVRGPGEGPIVLSERELEASQHLALSVEQQPNHSWSVSVTLTPPQAGWLVLALGETAFRASFDRQGTAVVPDVPADLLAGAQGPDLTIGIERGGEES